MLPSWLSARTSICIGEGHGGDNRKPLFLSSHGLDAEKVVEQMRIHACVPEHSLNWRVEPIKSTYRTHVLLHAVDEFTVQSSVSQLLVFVRGIDKKILCYGRTSWNVSHERANN
ncbi:hypothetical protein TNCV_4522751 [Trichonephila clavipes]|nr:hypothetical protein TNCV_4522751 [Trichonephila clavipes]